MKPINPTTPSQIGSVIGVDRMDSIDRAKLEPEVKFQLLCAEARALYGRDPRSGGFAFVGRSRVLLQLLKDVSTKSILSLGSIIKLQRAVVLGKEDSDIIGWWSDVPIIVRGNIRNDDLWLVALNRIPESKPADRQRAGKLRMAAHYGQLDQVRD
jgi:hypothetical protein